MNTGFKFQPCKEIIVQTYERRDLQKLEIEKQ